ncbi:MAG: hypothetical protein ACXV8K_16645, partial [Ilumatobacteraceae bacterium]
SPASGTIWILRAGPADGASMVVVCMLPSQSRASFPRKFYTPTIDHAVLSHHDRLPYEARWPNQGEVPPSLLPVGPDSAWSPLFVVPGEPASS